jgi:hypothetical protein
MGARTFVTPALTHAARSAVHRDQDRRLENKAREISRTMNDVLARAACDLKDDSPRWQDIAKDIENGIAVRSVAGAYWHRHHSSSRIPELRPLDSLWRVSSSARW